MLSDFFGIFRNFQVFLGIFRYFQEFFKTHIITAKHGLYIKNVQYFVTDIHYLTPITMYLEISGIFKKFQEFSGIFKKKILLYL